VNGNNGACTITNDSVIIAKVVIQQSIPVSVITINNLRNPKSTQYYSFNVKLTNAAGLTYYSLVSPNYQATVPYTIIPQITSSTCINNQPNTLTVTFPYLPFSPLNCVLIDDDSATSFSG